MLRFQSWTVSIFMMNFYCIVGIEDLNKPVKRPWLDLNLDPQDEPEPSEEIIYISVKEIETAAPIIEDGSSSAQIHENDSSSVYDPDRQREMEKWFKESKQTWNELRCGINMSDEKWEEICVQMIQKWKKEVTLQHLRCYPSPYIKGGKRRRMNYKEMKQRKVGDRSCDAPDLLSCQCSYCYLDNQNRMMGKQEYFGVKHYQNNKYFFLERGPDKHHTTYRVSNIYTLVFSSQVQEKKD